MVAHSEHRHLAEVNIGRLLGGPDDPRMIDFYRNLALVNKLAERMPGFVWRLKGDSGENALSIAWPGDPTMNVNLSVWESAEALGRFVFQTFHRRIYTRKHDFFEVVERPMFTLWWIEPGHIPTVEEARQRLEYYRTHGSTDFAFGWADLPAAKEHLKNQCAV